MKYKCIIFDCDGVLVDSEEISILVLIEMAKGLGVNINREYAIEHFTGQSLNKTFLHIENLSQTQLPKSFEKDFRKLTFDLFKTDLKPIKGILNILDQITIPYCVASNGPIEKINLNLKTTDLFEKFENKIFSSYQIGKWKPDPSIFLHAAKEMGFEPSECAVVEDSLTGVVAGRKGGFDVFGFANERNKQDIKNEGATVFFEMDKLLDLLN